MTRQEWDEAAATFDEAPDHGLSDPAVRAAWQRLLTGLLPPAPARVADLGCGTGTLTRLLTDAGYEVDGVDFSPEMVSRARIKAPQAHFFVADAADPPLPDGHYDAVLCRHVLWALPDPAGAVDRWTRLLADPGILLLIEGRWDTGAGLAAADVEKLVRRSMARVEVLPLDDPALWGSPISDERYAVVGRG